MIQEFVKELINELEKIPTEYRHEEYNSAIWDVIKFTKGLAEKYSDAAAVPITPEMKADMVDCIKETKIPGGGKDCNKCSVNKTDYYGKAFCEVEQIKEKILQGTELVTPDIEEHATGTSMEKLMIEYDGQWVPKEMCTIDRNGEADDCIGCRDMCEQIREMDRLYTEKCKEVAELEKRLEAMIEPWE